MIQFLLNGAKVEIEDFAPNTTVLEWIRTKTVSKGTKEGCATGDCGACTLLVGEILTSENTNKEISGQWHYKAINSCLMLLGNAHGKHIITIEAVSTELFPALQDLHPIQKAIVECHASQCGFCTPGIVMSLLALYINNESYPGSKETIHTLGGNLCRCTGYSPILKAAEKMFDYDRVAEPWSEVSMHFKNDFVEHPLTQPFLSSKGCKFYLPQSIEDLLALKRSNKKARLVAGGTDLAIELSQNLIQPEVLISVAQTKELKQVTETEQGIEIGAAVSYSEFVEHLCVIYPEATELFERLGSKQVRNSGTLGGSLGNASPIGDPAPLLIALNAKMLIQSANNSRVINVEDFFVDYRKTVLKPGEVICKIYIPQRKDSLKLACHKISKRFEDDISTVCLILAVEHRNNIITAARCALGGMAAIPARSPKMEHQLIGGRLNEKTFIKAGEVVEQDFSPMTDVRASANYRLLVTQNIMHRIGVEFSEKSTENKLSIPIQTRIAHASL